MSIEIFKGFIRYKICIVEIYWSEERETETEKQRERNSERKREREIDEKERERLMASFLLNVPPPLGVGLYHI